ncbi:hypothetical protein OAG71_00705 [bacterium]|nr:hypothetical protein [bacterium]
MPQPFHEYSKITKSLILCLLSAVLFSLGAVTSWVQSGSFLSDSPVTIINALVLPFVLITLLSGGDTNVPRRRAHTFFVSVAFGAFLLCVAVTMILFNFPAPRSLAIMPVLVVLFYVPFMMWRNWPRDQSG